MRAVLVGACALPLVTITWHRFTPTERSAEALGGFVWVVVMAIVGERQRRPSDARSLRSGALATAMVHAGLAIFGGPLGVFLWFAPAVRIGAQLTKISHVESDFGNAFMWTLVCGAQTAIVAWLCGRVIERSRYTPVRSRDAGWVRQSPPTR